MHQRGGDPPNLCRCAAARPGRLCGINHPDCIVRRSIPVAADPPTPDLPSLAELLTRWDDEPSWPVEAAALAPKPPR